MLGSRIAFQHLLTVRALTRCSCLRYLSTAVETSAETPQKTPRRRARRRHLHKLENKLDRTPYKSHQVEELFDRLFPQFTIKNISQVIKRLAQLQVSSTKPEALSTLSTNLYSLMHQPDDRFQSLVTSFVLCIRPKSPEIEPIDTEETKNMVNIFALARREILKRNVGWCKEVKQPHRDEQQQSISEFTTQTLVEHLQQSLSSSSRRALTDFFEQNFVFHKTRPRRLQYKVEKCTDPEHYHLVADQLAEFFCHAKESKVRKVIVFKNSLHKYSKAKTKFVDVLMNLQEVLEQENGDTDSWTLRTFKAPRKQPPRRSNCLE